MTPEQRMRKALQRLIRMYVANLGRPGSEFISCITPEHSSDLSPEARKKSKVWAAWDEAREAVK